MFRLTLIHVHAAAPQNQAMTGQLESELTCHHTLLVLDQIIFKFEDLTTIFTDQMIMMIMSHVHRFILTLSVVESSLMSDPCLTEELHRSIDRGIADARHFLLNQRQELIKSQVTFSA